MRRTTTIDSDVITAIPVTRSYNSLMQLMPNTVTQAGSSSDVQTAPGMVVFGGSGGRSNEGRLNVDGISVGSAFNGAGVSSYIADVGNAREITMVASGGLGEAENGGPSLNVVPKEGGNAFHGAAYLSGRDRGDGRQQLFAGLAGSRPDGARPAAQDLGLHRRRRRADSEEPAVVLRHRP